MISPLKIEYQATALSEYALQLSPDRQRIEAVKNPRRIETHFASPQLQLWQASETEWLLALRRPDPAPRRNRGNIIALARQLPLLNVSAIGSCLGDTSTHHTRHIMLDRGRHPT